MYKFNLFAVDSDKNFVEFFSFALISQVRDSANYVKNEPRRFGSKEIFTFMLDENCCTQTQEKKM